MDKIERLQEAIDNGEVLQIVYFGGSRPNSKREIAPISIKDGKIRARCFISESVKSFVIDKMGIFDDEDIPEEWEAKKSTLPPLYGSLLSLLQKETSNLTDYGWHIESKPNTISLHSRFKNGKPKKGYDVSLNFEEYTCDVLMDEDGEFYEENHRKRKRPWVVGAKGKTTRSVGSIGKAAPVFLSWAKELAPNSQ